MVKLTSPFRFGKNFQKEMNDLSNNWNNYSKESKLLHKEYYELSEELHKLLKNNVNKENINYLRAQIVSIEKEIDSLKQKYYESFDYSLYRPEGSNL